MPALANSKVGSSSGITAELRTNRWAYLFWKKLMKSCRISLNPFGWAILLTEMLHWVVGGKPTEQYNQKIWLLVFYDAAKTD